MANTNIGELFDMAQRSTTNHKKYTKMLYNIYQQQDLQIFFDEFKKYLLAAFVQHSSHCFANSIITFASSFCVQVITDYEKRMRESNEEEDYETHPLFVLIVSEILKYVPLSDHNVRFHACQFLGAIFTNFGPDITISDTICDKIQRAMLRRTMEDPKPQVRIQAIRVLTRLQNPYDMNCSVIESFINSLIDPMPSVRKVVVENIAPCRNTLNHIVTRLRDVDASVRTATYIKLSKLSPKTFTIICRQSVIMNGLLDSSPVVKRTFEQVLLTKWLNTYNSNVIEFILALKLDANEDDINQTDQIYEKLLPIIFKTMSLQELLEQLELEKDTKVVPTNSLTIERATYWYCLIKYLKDIENVEMEIDNAMPPVINLIACINSFVASKSEKTLDRWEYLEYQQILRKLFELLWKLDNSDEFGRQAMQKLLISVLTNVKMEEHVLNVVIQVFHSIIPDGDKLAYELCSIIADIKDPLETVETPAAVKRDQEMQIAQLKVKLHLLTDDTKKAAEERQYELVDALNKEGEILTKQVKDLEEKFKEQLTQIRKPAHDADTVCRCLDIMIAFLVNVPIAKLPNSLITFKEEFLRNENMDMRFPGVYRRIFRISCLYCVVDKNMALETLELICTPLIDYRVSSSFEKKTLEIAVGTVSDLIRIHGPEIFEDFATKEIEKSKNSTNETAKRAKDRTLYCEGGYDSETEVSGAPDVTNVTSSVLIDIMLSMLDDDHPDLRAYVAMAIMKLVVRGLCVNSSLLTRLLLKWFNPILDTEDKHDQKVQRYIGEGLTKYIHEIQSAAACLESAIIPTLCFIGNAPKTSPLAEVNYDDVLNCLIKFTRIRENAVTNIHKQLAYSILSRVTKINEPATRILTKMLTVLDIPTDEPNVIKELSQQILAAQENVSDKASLTSLKRYYNKLNAITGEINESGTNTTGVTNTTCTSTPARGRSRPSNLSNSTTDEGTLEDAANRLTINENSRISTTSSKKSLRSVIAKNINNDLNTIEEQGENSSDDLCSAHTSTANDSQESNNSTFFDVQEGAPSSVRKRRVRSRICSDGAVSHIISSTKNTEIGTIQSLDQGDNFESPIKRRLRSRSSRI